MSPNRDSNVQRTTTTMPAAQLHMSGMPEPVCRTANAGSHNVWPGQQVLYLGNISGGPRFGARGVVKQTLGRRAKVDMGPLGTWHIPYYFLTVPMRVREAERDYRRAPTVPL